MICSTTITSVANTLNKFHLSATIFNEFTSTYYDNKNDYFKMLLQKYTASAINNIYHPVIIEEFKANMDKTYYKQNIHKGVVKPYLKRELDIIINEENWLK